MSVQLKLDFTAEPCYQVSEIDVIYRSKFDVRDRPKVITSKDAYDIFLKTWDMDKIELLEQFKVLYLNRGNYVLALFQMSVGGITGTVADPRIGMVAALKINACSMILAHNHPSSALKPSRADEDLTRKFKEGGKMLDIQVLDSMIITKHGYYSMADEGLLY